MLATDLPTFMRRSSDPNIVWARAGLRLISDMDERPRNVCALAAAARAACRAESAPEKWRRPPRTVCWVDLHESSFQIPIAWNLPV